ncbi:MAG: radical SAM protein [Kiritimatiellae bacterium]|nr:radical SAM protein [Kiritimatiellia bacterium]
MATRFLIDASTMCQLRCPVCPQSKGQLKTLGIGFLKFVDFKAFVDDYPNIKHIELSNWGEMFLNPELIDIIAYAHEKDVAIEALNGVNFNTVTDEMIECLVKYKFRAIRVSIDGASQEVYSIYRRGGNFDTVIRNVRKLNDFKRQYGTAFPRLVWQFILFGHNQHELPIAREMARELNMEFCIRRNSMPGYSPVTEPGQTMSTTDSKTKTDGQASQVVYGEEGLSCFQLWESPQINWDGRLLGCCMNVRTDYGNVFTAGLRQCLSSEKYVRTKRVVLGELDATEDLPCFYCPCYRTLRSSKTNPLRKRYTAQRSLLADLTRRIDYYLKHASFE